MIRKSYRPTKTAGIMAVLGLLVLPEAPEAAVFHHPGSMHRRTQLDRTQALIKSKTQPWVSAYSALDTLISKALLEIPSATAKFDVPGFYRDSAGHRAAKLALEQDSHAAYVLALAYHLDPDPAKGLKAADKAVALLMDWADCKEVTGFDGQLVMTYLGTTLITAADLMHDYAGWRREDRDRFLAFARNVFRPVTVIKTRENNWGDWGLLASLSVSHLLNDSLVFAQDIESVKKKIASSIAADGSMPMETARGDRGLWYTYFALAPLASACQVILNHAGTDLFEYTAPNGRTIRSALDYLFPYAKNHAAWPHGKQINIPSPSSWPGNLYEAMAAKYNRSDWGAWVADSRPIKGPATHHGWSFPTLLNQIQYPPTSSLSQSQVGKTGTPVSFFGTWGNQGGSPAWWMPGVPGTFDVMGRFYPKP